MNFPACVARLRKQAEIVNERHRRDTAAYQFRQLPKVKKPPKRPPPVVCG